MKPKFKVGDYVKYKDFEGQIAYVIKSHKCISYGVIMDFDLKLYHFNEKVLELCI